MILRSQAVGNVIESKFGSVNEMEDQFYNNAKSIFNNDMSEDEKKQMTAMIYQKLKSGKKLSPKEVDYIRQTDANLYMMYVRVRASADSIKQNLKSAKTKQQANNAIAIAVNSVSDKDPAKEYILAAVQNIAEKFKHSSAYAKLPDTEDDSVKKKKKGISKIKEDWEKDDEEDVELDSWSPLNDEINSMPKFNVMS